MEKMDVALGKLMWQGFNLLVLAAVFVYLAIRLAKAVRKAMQPAEKTTTPKLTPKTLGQSICDHRKACRMTQEFVAESLDVTRQAVSKWESGASIPSTANLLALAKLFQVDAAELLRAGKDEKQ